jgi:drug/metabolite transporter (DMT)-like permease
MVYLYLAGAVLCAGLLSICATSFNKKNSGDFLSLYNLITTSSSFLVWSVIFILNPSFSLGVLAYSALFSVFYISAFAGLYNAFKYGSASITAFVKQLSLIMVALWGIIFWENPLSYTLIIGIGLVLVALTLCFKRDKSKPINSKWTLFAFVLIIGNAGCSVVQKYQQLYFDGCHGNLLMFAATFFASGLCLLLYMRGKRTKISYLSNNTVFLPVIAGVSSAMLNVFVLLMIKMNFPESVFFPIIGVGGVILTALVSVAIYKEKLNARQWMGFAVGLLAIILLNL